MRVSLIIPTGNRTILLRRALHQIARQTYTGDIEVVIADGGARPFRPSSCEWFVPRPELDDVRRWVDARPAIRVRYVRVEETSTVGGRRNVAVENATGDVIVHWDDDDFYARSYLETQVSWIESSGVDLGGMSQFYYYDFLLKRGWQSHLWESRRQGFGACFIYRKDLWRRVGGFPDIQRGEDTEFANAVKARGLRYEGVDRPDLFVYIRHTKNISSYTVPIFHPHWTEAARSVIGDDIAFYDDLAELVNVPSTLAEGPQFHLPVDLRTFVPRPGR